MNNEELKKKIVEVIDNWADNAVKTKRGGASVYDPYNAAELADALIAAGIGDVSELKKHRVVVEKSLIPEDDNAYVLPNIPPTVKQLYSGEEVEKIVKERKELKDELRSKVEYIHEQDEVIKEYKRRAEVAQLIAERACELVFSEEINDEDWVNVIFNYKKEKGIREIGITTNILYDYLKDQAEKELAEEGEDD